MRIAVIDIDDPGQHAAMVEKLDLPFPMLSDPDRTGAIDPYGVADPKDPRGLAHPAVVLLDAGGNERFRFVSRDFADRLPEDGVLEAARGLGLAPVGQDAPLPGLPAPGARAIPLDQLLPYFRGARFAALAMGLRHRHVDASIADDSKAYVALMDLYVGILRDRRRPAGDS